MTQNVSLILAAKIKYLQNGFKQTDRNLMSNPIINTTQVFEGYEMTAFLTHLFKNTYIKNKSLNT